MKKYHAFSLLLLIYLQTHPVQAQTETFNYKQALSGSGKTLNANIQAINRATGEVVFGGGDSRGPTTPGLTFTWVWGDGTTTSGFFSQTKKYSNVNRNYLAKVIANYSATERDSVEMLVDFVPGPGKLMPIALDARFKVFLPNQPVSLSSSNGYGIPALRPLPEITFTDVSRSDFEYLFQIGATIEYDLVNGDIVMPGGKFEQYALRDSTYAGAYALWYARPVSFGIGNGYLKGADSDFSSMYHEMAHNITLNFPANYQYGGKTDGSANAIFSEAIAQIFQHTAGYELINNYQKYGLDDTWLFKLKANFTSNIRFQRAMFDEYKNAGMPFQTYYNASQNDTQRGREVLRTFLTVPYVFFRYVEQENKGYRQPVKRLMQFLARFNADWQKRYDPQNDTPAGNAFRATLWTAAISHTFQRDLRADFRAINYPVSDADWAFLNPSLFSVSANALSLSAVAGSAASVSVTSTATSWSVVSSQPWLTASIARGSGSQSVTLTATANASASSRTAVVTLSATDFSDQVVTVVQAGAAVSSCSLTASLTATSLTLCQGNSATLTVSATGSQSALAYTWQRDGLALGNLSPTLSVSTSGTYSVTAIDVNNCSASSSVTVVASSAFTPLITGSTTFCSGQTLSLTAAITTGSPPFSYSWQREQTPVSTSTTSSSLSVSLPGTYQVTATDTKGCVGTSAAFTLTQKATPTAQIIGVGLLSNNTASLSAAAGTGWAYQWNQDGIAITGATATPYTVRQSGSYNVVVSSSGCTGTSPGLVVNLAPATGGGRLASEPAPNGSSLFVSPNPSSGQITIRLQLAEPSPAIFRLTDLAGRTYGQWASGTSQTSHHQQADVRAVPPGLYLVIAEAAGERLVRKVLKE